MSSRKHLHRQGNVPNENDDEEEKNEEEEREKNQWLQKVAHAQKGGANGSQQLAKNPQPGPSHKPPFLRSQSIRDCIESSARFFGIPPTAPETSERPTADESKKTDQAQEDEEFWRSKRLKRLYRKYGIKAEEANKECTRGGEPSVVNTPEYFEGSYNQSTMDLDEATMRNAMATTRKIGKHQMGPRRDSAMSIVMHSLRSFYRQGSLSSLLQGRQGRYRSSFNPEQIDSTITREVVHDADRSTRASTQHLPSITPPAGSFDRVRFTAGQSFDSENVEFVDRKSRLQIEILPTPSETIERPQQLPMSAPHLQSGGLFDGSQCVPLEPSARKTFSFPSRPPKRIQGSDYAASQKLAATPGSIKSYKSVCSLDDELFFSQLQLKTPVAGPRRLDQVPEEKSTESFERKSTIASGKSVTQALGDSDLAEVGKTILGKPEIDDFYRAKLEDKVQPDRPEPQKISDEILNKVKRQVIDKKQYKIRAIRRRGEGVFGRFCLRRMKRSSELSPLVKQQIANAKDERPFFTYWITTVQVIILILSIIFYGFGPFGMSRVERKGEVLHTSITYKMVSLYEPANFWLGPSHANLIRLGAKYSPCMRSEPSIRRLIEEDHRIENQTGCCIYDDGHDCFQTLRENCPSIGATFHSWARKFLNTINNKNNLSLKRKRPPTAGLLENDAETDPFMEAIHSGNGRFSVGPVCGQDPILCKTPPSIEPTFWPNDLSEWPICEEVYTGIAYPPHMKCKLTGRPCCIMQMGQCRIATKEYCDFVEGTFHENATLCSQVKCLEDVCGMLPFVIKDQPDQISRLFVSLFIHAGIIHCSLTVFLQLWLMRDLEYMLGWKRMAILYLGSGIGGNLASSIFVPFQPQVGPTASLIGIQAALLVDAYYNSYLIKFPFKAYLEHFIVIILLFIIGLFPWIDNWTHLFGFIFGLLISLIVFPYLSFVDKKQDPKQHRRERRRRIVIVAVSSIILVTLFFLLGYIFFANIELSCSWCWKFNCLPLLDWLIDPHFCDNQGLRLETLLPI
ncbi:unnamed protein product, partial [Mesorhabditis belari]|uniref:Peptidase S54 rhomboid domain-containing protein n=1 Tax=Mesorhabditis belari TaxID=2138241 RepID=A0AAF3F4V3_9BILA